MLTNHKGFFVVLALTFMVLLTILSSTYISYKDVFVLSKIYGKSDDSKSVSPTDITLETYRDYIRPIDLVNSTTLFNSIFAALRQAGSDIHPIGLSYFPAIIPKGTLMYHAGKPDIPTGLEWLAMDHEFSYNFGVKSAKYGRNASKSQKHGPPGGFKPPNDNKSGETAAPKKDFKDGKNHFLTFKATRDLTKFLYFDGASAAKTESGEMDTQKLLSDIIAYKLNLDDDNPSDGNHRVMAERQYADRICLWGKQFGLDGVIRVEVGFEVILCDFNNGGTELVSNITIPKVNQILGLPEPVAVTKENGWPLDDVGLIIEDQLTSDQKDIMDKEDYWQKILNQYNSMQGFDQLRAGVVHDKRDNRVKLDYRYLVTGINRTVGNVNPNGRRLLNDDITFETQVGIVDDLEKALNSKFDAHKSTDWQQVIDEIVDKFAPTLKMIDKILNSGEYEDMNAEDIALQVTRYTIHVVARFSGRDNTILLPDNGEFGFGRDFAVYEYTRPLVDLQTDSDFMIWSSVVNVVTEVVDAIYDIHDLLLPIVTDSLELDTELDAEILSDNDINNKLNEASDIISDLVGVLNWIAFDYKCDRKCEWDEICYTPSWGPSPLSWADPGTTEAQFGFHFDEEVDRLVVNKEFQCINADFLIKK